MAYDRAATLTVTVLQVFSSSAPKPDLRRRIETALRDEIADIERQVAADRNLDTTGD
jgi:hypothetical protein